MKKFILLFLLVGISFAFGESETVQWDSPNSVSLRCSEEGRDPTWFASVFYKENSETVKILEALTIGAFVYHFKWQEMDDHGLSQIFETSFSFNYDRKCQFEVAGALPQSLPPLAQN